MLRAPSLSKPQGGPPFVIIKGVEGMVVQTTSGERHEYTDVNLGDLGRDAQEQSLTRLQSVDLLRVIENGMNVLRRKAFAPSLGPLALAGDDLYLWN